MIRRALARPAVPLLLLLAVGLAGWPTPAQHDTLPDPIPPPMPRKPPPEDATDYEPLTADSDAPWEISNEILNPLYETAEVYQQYTRRFTCNETAREADYDKSGAISGEKLREYGYLLVKASVGNAVREYRQLLGRDGSVRGGEVKDEEPFPPAYAWVFLFSRFNEPFFSLRYLGERFDGFDWVHEIQFKGSMPFTDGKDVRQWEGRVLVDAVTHTPLEIRAEPSGQQDRIRALYDRWAKTFNLLGFRTGQRPLGYRAHIQFRHRREGLSFPTELRYDTFNAVSVSRTIPTRASIRTYSGYRIQKIRTDETVGEAVEP